MTSDPGKRNLEFAPITRDQATEYIRWRYEAPYDLYNIPESIRHIEIEAMLDRSNKVFAVLSDGEFIGVRSFGDDGRVEGGEYDGSHQDTGGALRPELTGKGLGQIVLRAGLRFGMRRFGFTRFRVTVAAFNQRALKVCRRAGFVEKQRFSRSDDGHEFIVLTLACDDEDPSISP